MGMDTKLHPKYDSDYDYLSRSHFQLNHISKRGLAVQGGVFCGFFTSTLHDQMIVLNEHHEDKTSQNMSLYIWNLGYVNLVWQNRQVNLIFFCVTISTSKNRYQSW